MLSRRQLLVAAGVAGVAGLAGCGGVTDRTVSASNVSMDGATMSEMGFEQAEGRTFTNTASREVAGVEGSVTAESRLTVFTNEESTPDPNEEQRWADSDSELAQWSDNSPVRAVPGSDAIDGDGIMPGEGDQFESMPADATTLLVPETDDDSDRAIAAAPMADIEFGERASNGEVTFDPAVPYVDDESFAPSGLAFVPEDA